MFFHMFFVKSVFSTSAVLFPVYKWPMSNGRDIRKGNAGIDAGLEGSLSSFEETSFVVVNLRCEGEMEGRLQSKPTGG